MRRFLLALGVAAGLAAPATALAVSWSDPTPVPNSPPADNGLPGGEPSFVFDPSGDGHAYVDAPGGDGSKGVGFWVSSDAARTFSAGRAIGSAGGGGDSEVEVGIDHTVYVADLEVAANAVCRSHDFGKTFGDNCETGLASDQAGPESDREWLTASPKDKNVLYLTYHDFAAEAPIIEKSTDGGSSFTPCGSVFDPAGPAFSTFTTGGTDLGKPAIAADDTIYVPITEPSSPLVTGSYNNFYVSVGDGGCNNQVFRTATVYSDPGANLANIFSFVAVDGGGTVWAITAGKLAADKPYTINVFTSRDKGMTWSRPIVVNPPSQKAAVFPALAPGRAAGQAVVGWYGTDTSDDPNNDKDVWRYYGATTTDFGATWDVAPVTAQPFHYGAICTQGILCTGNRNLADFSSVGVDPVTGCTVHVFPGDPYDTPDSQDNKSAAAYVARQTGGTCLSASSSGGSGGTGSSGTPVSATTFGGSTSGSGTGGKACRDRIAPTSHFRGHAAVHSRRVTLHGRSTDRGCGKHKRGKVVRVEVAIGRRVSAKSCRYLKPDGSFGPAVDCLRPKYLTARGTGSWRITTGRLPRGRYIAWARGIDSVGNREHKAHRHLTRFSVR